MISCCHLKILDKLVSLAIKYGEKKWVPELNRYNCGLTQEMTDIAQALIALTYKLALLFTFIFIIKECLIYELAFYSLGV